MHSFKLVSISEHGQSGAIFIAFLQGVKELQVSLVESIMLAIPLRVICRRSAAYARYA